MKNLARAPSGRDQRKEEIDTTLATTRISTASMGKFDKKLEGEKKLRGVKRKVISKPMQLNLITNKRMSSSNQLKAARRKTLWPSFQN